MDIHNAIDSKKKGKNETTTTTMNREKANSAYRKSNNLCNSHNSGVYVV